MSVRKIFVCFMMMALMVLAGCNSNADNTVNNANEEAKNTATTTFTTTMATTTTEAFDFNEHSISEYIEYFAIVERFHSFPVRYIDNPKTMESFDELINTFGTPPNEHKNIKLSLKKVLVVNGEFEEWQVVVQLHWYDASIQASGATTVYAPKAYYDPSFLANGGFGSIASPNLYYAGYDGASIKQVCLNEAAWALGNTFSEETMQPYVEYVTLDYSTYQ